MIVELVPAKVVTPTNIRRIGIEVTQHLTMTEGTLTEHRSTIHREEIRHRKHPTAPQNPHHTGNRLMTVTTTAIDGRNTRHRAGHRTKRPNRRNILNRAATPRTIDSGTIRQMTKTSITTRKPRRANVHGRGQGIADNWRIVFVFCLMK